MKSRNFRLLLGLGIFSILGIASLQYFWFNQAYSVQKKEFDIKVSQALREVAEEISSYNGANQGIIPIEQLSDNYFVVMINDQIDLKLLEDLLLRKFSEKYIEAKFSYTVFDCASDNLVYGSPQVSENNRISNLELPKWDQDQYYFGVYFDGVSVSILSGMQGWFILSFILILVVSFFGFSLIVIFRQKQLTEVQKDFVNNMTHELKTPLTSIQLSAEILSKSAENKQLAYLNIIGHEAKKLRKQIEQVLSYARQESGKLEIERKECSLSILIKETIDRFNFVNQDKLEMEFDTSSQVMCKVDTLHLEQVIENLAENSIKYGVKPNKVAISLHKNEDRIAIIWNDNGPGIKKSMSKKIFQPFYRVEKGDVHNTKGFGLGLSYVKNVMKAHGGDAKWMGDGANGFFELSIKCL